MSIFGICSLLYFLLNKRIVNMTKSILNTNRIIEKKAVTKLNNMKILTILGPSTT